MDIKDFIKLWEKFGDLIANNLPFHSTVIPFAKMYLCVYG